MTAFTPFCYDGCVKKCLPGVIILFLLVLPAFLVGRVLATSQQAYSDYLNQFDTYRQSYSSFQLARDSYLKYQNLTSQTAAMTATQTMMTQRDLLLRSYLSFLNEKLNEDQGLDTGTKGQYQANLQKEIAFLDTQNQNIAGITSLDDATRSSSILENHYVALQITISQTIIGVTIGKLEALAHTFDQNLQTAQGIISSNAALLPPEKTATINQWLIQIQNTRSLYQQKIDAAATASATGLAPVTSIYELDQKTADINKQCTDAQQLLTQLIGFLGELVTALQYK